MLSRKFFEAVRQFRTTIDNAEYLRLQAESNTNMRKAGMHDGVTMVMTGHSTEEMRKRYDKIDLDDLRYGIRGLEGFLKNVNQNVNNSPTEQEKKGQSKFG